MDIDEVDAIRMRALENIYRQAGGTLLRPASVEAMGRELGIHLRDAEVVRSYLEAQRWVKGFGFKSVLLTQQGINFIEQRMREAKTNTLNETRLDFLAMAVEQAENAHNGLFESAPIGEALGLPEVETEKVVSFCLDKGFIRPGANEGSIYYVERKGKDAVESGSMDVWQAPVFNQMNISGDAIGAFQQGGHHAVQVATVSQENATQLLPLVETLLAEVVTSKLGDEVKEEVEAALKLMAAKLKAKDAPKKSFLLELWNSARAILESGAGGVLTKGAMELIPQIAALLA